MTKTKTQKLKQKQMKSQNMVLQGSGDYKAIFKGLKNFAKKAVKTAAQDALGTGEVNAILSGAKALRRGVGTLSGRGDYTVNTNSLFLNTPNGGSITPVFSNDGKRGFRIVEREYLGDVSSGILIPGGNSTIFTNRNYRINPADPRTFPWVSHIAALFDQWEPNGLVFEFVTTSSSFNGVGQSLGTVITATDYDTTDPLYRSKQEMANSAYARSCKPSENLIHGIECDPSERPTKLLYTRYTATSSTTGGRNLSDLGNFQIATQGMFAAGVALGELWVSYDLTFYKKQMETIEYGSSIPYYQTNISFNVPNTKSWLFYNNEAANLPSFSTNTDVTLAWDATLHTDGDGVLLFPPNISAGNWQLQLEYTSPAAFAHAFSLVDQDLSYGILTGTNNAPNRSQFYEIDVETLTATTIFQITAANAKLVLTVVPTNLTGPRYIYLNQLNSEQDYL